MRWWKLQRKNETYCADKDLVKKNYMRSDNGKTDEEEKKVTIAMNGTENSEAE